MAGVSKRTIDYYTQMGLLTFVRTDSNYRLYEEKTTQDLQLIEHYKQLNMPLVQIKETLEFIKEKECTDLYKVENHIEQVMGIIKHLNEEMNELKPIFEKLDEKQKEAVLSKFSPQSVTLAHSILMLFS